MALLESTPLFARAADEAIVAGSKFAEEAAEILSSAPKVAAKTDDAANLAIKETAALKNTAQENATLENTALENVSAVGIKYAPVYEREGNRLFLTEQKIDRLKMTKIINSADVAEPQIKLFPDAPPQITVPTEASDISKANAVLIADYANVIHWNDEARAAVSFIERPSKTVASQWTKTTTTPEQMEQLAIEGATGYLQGISKNPFGDYLAKNFGRFYFERLYHARSAVLREVFKP
jgi:hypothetical protein